MHELSHPLRPALSLAHWLPSVRAALGVVVLFGIGMALARHFAVPMVVFVASALVFAAYAWWVLHGPRRAGE